MSVNSRKYECFLEERKRDLSTFFWSSRQLKTQVPYKLGPARSTAASHKEAVLKSPKIQELLNAISSKQKIPKVQLEKQLRIILDEIGYEKNLKLIRWLGYILMKIYNQILTNIYVNVDFLLKIKATMGNCPVIYVPSHRSYGDFILMSSLFFNYDIEIPAIAAGMDFHGMWGIGNMLRNTGAFFMRRTYNNDSLYWTTFKQYVYQIIAKGEIGIEFFIEGTRSRSNKSLTPKYGLLSMILKPFFFSEVYDLQFVPISICYDRILEESLFAFELLGVPKPKESTSGFFKSLKILKECFGNVHIHFSNPISAREFFGEKLDKSAHCSKPLHLQEMADQEKALMPSLAHEIVYRQQKGFVVTTFNLLSLTLNDNLARRKKPLMLPELTEEIIWLRGVLEALGAFVRIENLQKSIEDCFNVHQNLIEVRSDGTISLVQSNIVLDNINPSNLKAHTLSGKTLTYSVPFVMLQIYVNPTLQYLVDVALLVVILNSNSCLTREQLFNDYHFLRSLFSMEFVTFPLREETEFQTALDKSTELNLTICTSGSIYEVGNNVKLNDFLCTSFEPFLVSYYFVLLILESAPLMTEEKTVLGNIQKLLEEKLNNNNKDIEFIHPYCLNLDSLCNCSVNLSYMGAVKRTRRNGVFLYEINKEKVVQLKKKMEKYIPKCHIEDRLVTQFHIQNKL